MAEIRSAPLRDIAAQLLTWSDNQTAELLLKEIGFSRSGAGEHDRRGRRRRGDPRPRATTWPGSDAVDGSGLAGANRATCGLLHEVLADGRAPLRR